MYMYYIPFTMYAWYICICLKACINVDMYLLKHICMSIFFIYVYFCIYGLLCIYTYVCLYAYLYVFTSAVSLLSQSVPHWLLLWFGFRHAYAYCCRQLLSIVNCNCRDKRVAAPSQPIAPSRNPNSAQPPTYYPIPLSLPNLQFT